MIASTTEPQGEHCAVGGIRVDVGLDDDGDAVLDQSEIDATSYVCNGPADAAALCAFPAAWSDAQRCEARLDWTGADLSERSMVSSYLVGLDLTEANLAGADLRFSHLRWVSLRRANLQGAWFTNAVLEGMSLEGADLTGASLVGIVTSNVAFMDALLDGADFTGADLREAWVAGADMDALAGCPAFAPLDHVCFDLGMAGKRILPYGSRLSGLDTVGGELASASLEHVQLSNLISCPNSLPDQWACLPLGAAGFTVLGPFADLSELDLTNADFAAAPTLAGIDFSGSNLTGVDLSYKDLTGVRGNGLIACPSALPAEWRCLATTTGYTMFPLADLIRGVDLGGADLSNMDLSNTDLEDVNLAGANLSGANLTAASFARANLAGANFTGASLGNARFEECDLSAALFANADLTNVRVTGTAEENRALAADFSDAILASAHLDGLDLTDAKFDGADVSAAEFTDAMLSQASFVNANLAGTEFHTADLTHADFTGANLEGTAFWHVTPCPDGLPSEATCVTTMDGVVIVAPNMYFHDLDLTGADLTGLDLHGSEFERVDLTNTSFKDANLAGAIFHGDHGEFTDFSGANLIDAQLLYTLDGTLIFEGADLSGVQFHIIDGADLSGTTLVGAKFEDFVRNADFAGADLSGSAFWYDVSNCSFEGANLTDAALASIALTDVDFDGANLTGASFGYAYLSGLSSFGGANFTDAMLGDAYGFEAVDVGGAIWSNTECPTYTNSDDNGSTCVGEFVF